MIFTVYLAAKRRMELKPVGMIGADCQWRAAALLRSIVRHDSSGDLGYVADSAVPGAADEHEALFAVLSQMTAMMLKMGVEQKADLLGPVVSSWPRIDSIERLLVHSSSLKFVGVMRTGMMPTQPTPPTHMAPRRSQEALHRAAAEKIAKQPGQPGQQGQQGQQGQSALAPPAAPWKWEFVHFQPTFIMHGAVVKNRHYGFERVERMIGDMEKAEKEG